MQGLTVPPPQFSVAPWLACTKGCELNPSASGMKPKKHTVCTGCQVLVLSSTSAPAHLLSCDKTKTDGDKHRTGGGLIRSLNHVIVTCRAILIQMLAPTAAQRATHLPQGWMYKFWDYYGVTAGKWWELLSLGSDLEKQREIHPFYCLCYHSKTGAIKKRPAPDSCSVIMRTHHSETPMWLLQQWVPTWHSTNPGHPRPPCLCHLGLRLGCTELSSYSRLTIFMI